MPAALETPASQFASPTATKRRRVLVVEDNPDGRDSLHMLLCLWGYDVRLAGDGMQGVRAALAFKPNIAVIDIGLPLLDGYGVAKQVRAAFGSSVHLVALTAYSDLESRRKALDAGFDHYLVKPADPDSLRRLLAA